MTVRRGDPWGEPAVLGPDRPVAATDGELADLVAAATADGHPLGPVGLLGGDLHRTLGAPPHDRADLLAGRGAAYPIDVGEVLVEREGGLVTQHVFVAHLVATAPRLGRPGRRWRGRTVVAMNGSFVGAADLGPRAHPNDGLLDVTDGALPWSQRRTAAVRELTGTHLPHPALAERRTASYEVRSDRPLALVVDGRPIGRTRHLEIRCAADAATIVA
jgi:hypothetical protein